MPIHPENLTHPSQAKTSASTNTQPPWYPIKPLSAAHIEMIKQSVHGLSGSRIRYHMRRMGHDVSKTHIDRVLKSAKGREFASIYSAFHFGGISKLVDHGAGLAPEAVYTELDIMRNPLGAERHRLSAAQDLMDRVGPPKISRQENLSPQPTTVIINLLPSQLSSFLAPPVVIESEVVMLPQLPSSTDD